MRATSAGTQLQSLPIVAAAMAVGIVLANGIAVAMIVTGAIAPPVATSRYVTIGFIAAAATCIALAPAIEALVGKSSIPPSTMRSPAQTYVASKLVGYALREAGGLIGMVLGLLTGQLVWPALFGALAIATILIAWPRADEMAALQP